ncbi:MAG: helix-turn-helix transcriptional regulator [Flavobacteriales bacterium]|nr:helix-turn-helix transcriptional regulator [Flavobacteriales bacterium]
MKFWIGEHIRQARVLKGVTQECLAGSIGRKQSYLSKVERGYREPGFHEVLVLLHLLGAVLPPWSVACGRTSRPPSKTVMAPPGRRHNRSEAIRGQFMREIR